MQEKNIDSQNSFYNVNTVSGDAGQQVAAAYEWSLFSDPSWATEYISEPLQQYLLLN